MKTFGLQQINTRRNGWDPRRLDPNWPYDLPVAWAHYKGGSRWPLTRPKPSAPRLSAA
ncbi:MAG: hypothetical protein HY360_01330 [Verrucomicrobia bacterium]|nr:hypothetical protein [Verrucomicrobiota bacterium]